jgi:hypothetical protein
MRGHAVSDKPHSKGRSPQATRLQAIEAAAIQAAALKRPRSKLRSCEATLNA